MQQGSRQHKQDIGGLADNTRRRLEHGGLDLTMPGAPNLVSSRVISPLLSFSLFSLLLLRLDASIHCWIFPYFKKKEGTNRIFLPALHIRREAAAAAFVNISGAAFDFSNS